MVWTDLGLDTGSDSDWRQKGRQSFFAPSFVPQYNVFSVVEGVYTRQETRTWLMICMLLMMRIYSEPCAANGGAQQLSKSASHGPHVAQDADELNLCLLVDTMWRTS